jgi:hypothetical protein
MSRPVIVELIRRSVQGQTQPFICRTDDGAVVYAKGRSANRSGLVAEWICARLGQALGLPMPPFAILDVPQDLIRHAWLPDAHELGSGPVFGSYRVEDAHELTFSAIGSVPALLRRDVLAFDWWVRNDDRTLSAPGGNPNLLWNPATAALTVFDHNLALGEDFSPAKFFAGHVFRDDAPALFDDLFAPGEYSSRLSSVLAAVWPELLSELPAEWSFVDEEQTLPADVQLGRIYDRLAAVASTSFWSRP